MRPRSTRSRVIALMGLALVPCGIMGLGVHDPDCPHHRPGATGSPHLAHGAMGHAGHGGGASAHAGAAPDTSRPGRTGTHGSSSDEDCHCIGVCVPGAHAVPPSLQALSVGPTSLPRVHILRELPSSEAQIIPVARRLPPATGPPLRA